MRRSFKEKQIALREAHLAQEEARYTTLPYGAFRKIKDWDDKGPTVVWEGTIVSPELSQPYKVQIHYGRAYPYRRPSVYPLDPRIENQRHQEPTKGRTDLPGGLCLLPHSPDRWVVGLTCHDLLERAVLWFKAYENGTLDYEFAPPEIERFFPSINQLSEPRIILVDNLLETNQTFQMKVREVNRLNALKLYKAYHINPETIFSRVSGYEVEQLQKTTCLLLGCGSVGSHVAELLIKTGIGTLLLVDKDEMRAGNVCRHVLGLDYIGQNKAAGLKHFLHKRNPEAKIGVFTSDILNEPEALSNMIGRSDLVVSCLGNDAAELFVSSAALPDSKAVLFCRSYLQGRVGQIFLYQPPHFQACFSCASQYLGSSECRIPRMPEVPYKDLVGLDGDCGAKPDDAKMTTSCRET